MPYELGLLIIIIIGIIKLGLFLNKRSEDQRKKNLHIASKSYNTRSTYRPPQESKPKLSKTVKTDVDITSDQVTLVASYISGRDEFYGVIEVLDGHYSTEDDIKVDKRESELLKSWGFLGFGDRYDAGQRSSDFADLAQQFKIEAQNIISEFREQGWVIEQSPISSKNDIYHLSR